MKCPVSHESTPLNAEGEAAWRRKLGSAANNRGWNLAERLTRTKEEDQEMLDAAHAAAHLWRTIGNDKNFALRHLLLGQVHALLGNTSFAMSYATQAYAFLTTDGSQAWAVALTHAVLANAAHCAGKAALHVSHYQTAEMLIAALPAQEDRDILLATLRVVPKPPGAAMAA